MANTYTLTGLTPREAVADAIHRCVLGLDSNDKDLFESACVKDESMSVSAGPVSLNGWETINGYFQRVFACVTTHIISNIRVELEEGAETASMTAHAMSYHLKEETAFQPEDTSYRAASLYDIDLVKDGNDGLWKIKKWDIKVLWTTGDIAVLHG